VIFRDHRDPAPTAPPWAGHEENDVAGRCHCSVHRRPAHVTGGGDDGPIHIGVIGAKLKVKEARAVLDGQKVGARARLSLWQHGQWVREIRGWTYSDARVVRGQVRGRLLEAQEPVLPEQQAICSWSSTDTTAARPAR
jgi:hypothetical protein